MSTLLPLGKFEGELQHEYRGTKDLAEKLREFIKDNRDNEAIKGCHFRVRATNRDAIDVFLMEAPWDPYNPHATSSRDRYSEEYERLKKFLGDFLTKYGYDRSDVMSDYFDQSFYAELMIGAYDKEFVINK